MKEVLKLSHIYRENLGSFELRDFNLTVGSGEIIYLAGNTDIEKYLVKDIITGMATGYEGSVYLRNRRQARWTSGQAYDNGIFYIDERQQLVPKLTVMENICVLKKTAPKEVVINRGKEYQRARELLELIGLQRREDQEVGEFSHFEKQLVCIAKMLYQNAHLLILDGMENKYSMQEILHMRSLLCVLSRMDLALVLLQRQPEEVLEVCTKCLLLRDGSDAKILFRPQITQEIISEYRLSHSQVEVKYQDKESGIEKSISEKFTVRLEEGGDQHTSMLGFYDLGIDSKIHVEEYLRDLDKRHLGVYVDGNCLEEVAQDPRQAVMIGSSSVEDLLYNLSLGENLAFPFRYMENPGKVLLNPSFSTYLRMEFLKKFDLNPKFKKLEQLDYFQRKLLSIYRWLQVGHPKCILLEEPYMNLQGDEVGKMQQYLKEISRQHAPVAIFSKDAMELMKTCDIILLSYRDRFIKYYGKQEFEHMIPEAIRMIDGLM